MNPLNLRPEVKAFCDAAETLLSPVIMQLPLTEAERSMIRIYMESLEKAGVRETATPA
ncbi:MAG: hypothetical protein LZF62_360020 [Nitrospira sp.]|jgi:hypothetical protein|nr:MAG: hypothetical protein LZF62_360020 [Nitrospira sp.]